MPDSGGIRWRCEASCDGVERTGDAVAVSAAQRCAVPCLRLCSCVCFAFGNAVRCGAVRAVLFCGALRSAVRCCV